MGVVARYISGKAGKRTEKRKRSHKEESKADDCDLNGIGVHPLGGLARSPRRAAGHGSNAARDDRGGCGDHR